MKKTVIIGLVLALLFMFSGCAAENSPSGSDSGSSDASVSGSSSDSERSEKNPDEVLSKLVGYWNQVDSSEGNFFIIKEENNQTPLFKTTGENFVFKYEKELMKRNRDIDSYYYDEIINTEEFCDWFLSFSNNQLKVISRDEYFGEPSKDTDMPSGKPKMLDKIEPIRYHR
jgi:hypothetical protein